MKNGNVEVLKHVCGAVITVTLAACLIWVYYNLYKSMDAKKQRYRIELIDCGKALAREEMAKEANAKALSAPSVTAESVGFTNGTEAASDDDGGLPKPFDPVNVVTTHKSTAVKNVKYPSLMDQPERKDEIRTVFSKGHIDCVEIRGHLFLTTDVSRCVYGSTGSTSILHAPFCPCMENRGGEVSK